MVKTRGLRRHKSQPGSNIPILNIKHSSAERNLVNVVLMTVCAIARSLFIWEWEWRWSWVWLTQLRTVHSMIQRWQKRDWTNDSERFFLANWPTQTELSKQIMKSTTIENNIGIYCSVKFHCPSIKGGEKKDVKLTIKRFTPLNGFAWTLLIMHLTDSTSIYICIDI